MLRNISVLWKAQQVLRLLVGTTWPHVECWVYSPMLTSNSTGASMALTIVAFMNAQCSLNFLLLWNFCTLYTSSLRISSTGMSGRSPRRVSSWTSTLPLYATPSPCENSTKIHPSILFRSFTINEARRCQSDQMLFLQLMFATRGYTGILTTWQHLSRFYC